MSALPQPSAVVIRYVLPDGTTSIFTMQEQSLTVGSTGDSAIRIPDRYLSRQHLCIERSNGQLFVTDLNSRNGTAINGRAIPPHTRVLWDGESLLVAAGTRFHVVSPPR